MDLRGIADSVITAVNPDELLVIQKSTGWTEGADGKRAPTYDAPFQVWGQVQNLTYRDLQYTDGLGLQGERRAIYLPGRWYGMVRDKQKGGDLITRPDGSIWLVAMVLEHWDGWTKVAATRQNAS